MKSPSLIVATSVLFAASSVTAWLEDTVQGCYSDLSGYTFNNTDTFQTDGNCQKLCAPAGYNAMATTKGSDCWCGAKIPSPSLKVDDALCDTPCNGYGTKTCGGANYFTVYVSGRVAKVETDTSPISSSTSSSSGSTTPSSTKSAAPSLVTVAGETIVVTAAPGSATSSASASTTTPAAVKSSSAPSKAGIAAGVVVGIVAIAAIAGGAFLFIRNKNRREVEEEYRRNAAVSSFIAGGGKPPTSSGGASSFNDTRLEPSVMAQRRMSDGSIADNQDYSRRILKVTNA